MAIAITSRVLVEKAGFKSITSRNVIATMGQLAVAEFAQSI
ncbi:hypothetical protein M595_2301 [Lyngbya aestuarii BL J]|uniref:Uncharacterized protein n=1 Tax=Lyngbya aestuarii BL J TaxID=1348334 RepID=U7QIC0_9CYAN|nr:hypothetical protein M595_2301 [Lyngbya aestuarii BL J]